MWELWGALRFGGTVVVVPYWVSRSPKVFYELLVQEHVTVLNQTPSAFQQLMQAEESAEIAEPLSLRLVIFGGESLDLQRLKPWFDRHGDQCPQLINMYGITETTVHVTQRLLSTEDLQQTATSVIGSPIPDLQVFILDNDQQPVPIGIPGEMYIGGEGVTRGYLNHPELTGTRFIPNPYSHNPGTRLYRSGDLARYLSNGDIEYLGRVDDQVKIRGFRIELGEIDSILTKHPKVRESVAIVREDQQDSQRLVAYIVWQHGESLPVEDLRRYLGMWLPDHMIPSAFVPLDSLPLTIHGKVDRNALPAPEATRPHVTQPLELPRTPVEQELAKIWCTLLGVDQVGIHDDFFDLGGHSLLLTQLANRIFDTFQISLPLRTLFDLSTIEQMTLALLERQVETIDETTIDAMLQKLDHLSPNQVSQLLDGT